MDHIGVPEAAEMLQVGESTVRRMIAAGQLTSWKVEGRYPRVSRAEVARLAKPDPRLTVKQVAERLGVSPQTVRSYIRKGNLIGVEVDWRGETRISEKALARFIPPLHGVRMRHQPATRRKRLM